MHVPGCPPVAAGLLAGISHIIAGEPASGDQLLGHLAADLDVPDVGTLHGSPTMPCLTRPAGQEDVLAEIPCPPRRSRAGPPIVLVEVHQEMMHSPQARARQARLRRSLPLDRPKSSSCGMSSELGRNGTVRHSGYR